MRRIVLPTDFSDASESAVIYGVKLANDLNVDILLINAFEEPHAGAANLISLEPELRKDAEAEMETLKKTINQQVPDNKIELKSACVHGSFMPVLTDFVSAKEDMVVMGTHGASGIRKILLGSNAADVVKQVDCPVLVIPPNRKYDMSHGIACGIDDNFTIDPDHLKWLENMIELTSDQRLSLINILAENETSTPTKVTIPASLEHLNVEVIELIGDDTSEGLNEYADKSGVDCMVIVKKDLGFWESIFHRSVSRDLSMTTHTPLLVLHSE
ncbi:MAG: universal stress protein [Crocinitomicaceae bacterium]|nr:universal stress protein [Crocinitomicaceae bacterium]